MKKLLIFVAVAAISGPTVKGQTDSSSISHQSEPSSIKGQYNNSEKEYRNTENKTGHFSIAINPSLPIGHFNTYSGFGFGGSLGWESSLSKNIGLTLNAGYIDYFGKTVKGVAHSDFNYIPVLGGLKYYMSGGFYIHGEAGAGFGTSDLGTSFWYGAGLGHSMAKGLDLELKYVGWHQNDVTNTSGSSVYNGTNGGDNGNNSNGSGSGTYGGHYSTIDLRLAYRF